MPVRLKVNVPPSVLPLALKPPQIVNVPLASSAPGSSAFATNLPVWVKVECDRPSANAVTCSTTLNALVAQPQPA